MMTAGSLDRDVGRHLRGLRCQRGLTLDDVARGSGLDPDRIAALEAGSVSGTLADLSACAGVLNAGLLAIVLPALAEQAALQAVEDTSLAWALKLNRFAYQLHDECRRALLIACAAVLASEQACQPSGPERAGQPR